MNILAELQKRGFQVETCAGRVVIKTSLDQRRQAHADGISVWEQVNEAIDEIMEEEAPRSVRERDDR